MLRLARAMKVSLTRTIRLLPDSVRYPLTVLLFWPTVAINRFVCHFFPASRRLYDRVHPFMIVGSVPCARADVDALFADGVRGVVNLCKEWDANAALYRELGIAQVVAPTIDFDAPTLPETLRCVAFIRERVERRETVFVHCKAGRGRSVCVALAYLVLHEGLSPKEADTALRRTRPHISKKWHLPLLSVIARMAEEQRAAGGAAPFESADGARPETPGAEADTAPLTLRAAS